jgi:hypothetical protein
MNQAGPDQVESGGGAERHPAITAAALLFFAYALWVVHFVLIAAYVALNGGLPPGFGSAPLGPIYDTYGLATALAAYGLFAAVLILGMLAGLWLWRGLRKGAILGLITLAPGPVFWYGFGLPWPPFMALIQVGLLAVGWRSLRQG